MSPGWFKAAPILLLMPFRYFYHFICFSEISRHTRVKRTLLICLNRISKLKNLIFFPITYLFKGPSKFLLILRSRIWPLAKVLIAKLPIFKRTISEFVQANETDLNVITVPRGLSSFCLALLVGTLKQTENGTPQLNSLLKVKLIKA